MFRRCHAGLGVLLLIAASLQAPLAHEHPDDPDHTHAAGLAHGHFGQLALHQQTSHEQSRHHDDYDADPGKALDHADSAEATIWLSWYPNAEPRVNLVYSVFSTATDFEPKLVSAGTPPEFTPQAHSPPQLHYLPARAPPV